MSAFTRSVLMATLVLGFACRPAWKSLETGSGMIQVADGPSLFWRALGTGGDTVVVVHGGVGLHQGYLLEPLAPLVPGRTLIFYDMRGRGRSSEVGDSSALTFDNDIADLESVRAHFKLERMTLVGHHWGAAVAALYAARHPGLVRRMLLLSPFPVHNSLLYEFTFLRGDSAHYARTLQLAGLGPAGIPAWNGCRRSWSLFFAPWRTDTLTPYERLARGMCDAPSQRLERAAWIRTQEQHSLGKWSWRIELNALTTPALVIEGAGTPVVAEAATRWAQHLPDARVLLLPPPYLFPWVGAPERFTAAADSFLRGRVPSAAVKPPPWQPN
jgi:proline iminopeptidase